MTSPIFLDANIPTYAGGDTHPFREPCIKILELVSQCPRAFWTDAEVLQEMLHRYLAINRWSQGKPILEGFVGLMGDRVEPVLARDVAVAAQMVGRWPGLSARDLLHLAVMQRFGSDAIITGDRDFDRVPHIQRLDPADFAAWRQQIELSE